MTAMLGHSLSSSSHGWAESLVEVFEREGYAVMRCDAETSAAIADTFATGAAFFHLPVEEKRPSFSLEHFEGYRDIGVEYSARPDRPDLSESFATRLMFAPVARGFLRPNALPLHAAMLRTIICLDRITNSIIELLVNAYDPLREAPPFRCTHGSHLQLNHYEPWRHRRDLLQDAHEDGLFVTITCSTAPGLEVFTADGEIRTVMTRPGELILMPGEILALLTGGRIQPLWHHVRNHREYRERQSLMYFTNPEPSSSLSAWIHNDTNVGIDIMQRAIDNPRRFGLPALPPVVTLSTST